MRTPHSNSPVSGTPLNPETEAQLSLPGILGVKQTQQAAGIEQNKQATAYFRADIRRADGLPDCRWSIPLRHRDIGGESAGGKHKAISSQG
jgi:hypothetical protein